MIPVPFARIAIWLLGIGAAILIILIESHSGPSEDVNGKIFAAIILFVFFSILAAPGLLLIERQPQMTVFGALAIGLSIAAYPVAFETFLSSSFFDRHTSVEVLTIVALASSQASLLLSFRRDDDSPVVNALVGGSLLMLALLAALVIVEISSPGTDISHKTLAVISVLYLLGALLPPCLRWEETEESAG